MQTYIRKNLRLENYSYVSAGYYFITICTKDKKYLFGNITNGQIKLNKSGLIAQKCWNDLPNHYHNSGIDTFMIMPNHVHGIIFLTEPNTHAKAMVRAGFKPAPTSVISKPKKCHGIPEIIRGFKTFSARYINEFHKTPGQSVWQRNYYERIIRNERELHEIRQYILDNPVKWGEDQENLK